MPLSRQFNWMDNDLDARRSAGLYRERIAITRTRPGYLRVEGREYVDFASNDYLGLAADARVRQAVLEYLERHGVGATASPLVVGFSPAHATLEERLARFGGSEAVLLLGSGFVLNVSLLDALAGSHDVILSDERNHASIIDGCRLSRASVHIYRHNDVEHLTDLLQGCRGAARRFVVTDSVFSMDGDTAPLSDLCEVAEPHDAILIVDESHGFGVLGPGGRGLAAQLGLTQRIPFRVATLSKALGSAGGFVWTTTKACEWLVQTMRGYMFSTALPPVCAVAADAALAILEAEPDLPARTIANANQLRDGLAACGWSIGDSLSAIVPVIVGEPEQTMQLGLYLRDRGFWVGAIRPPSVPPAQCRLRLCANAVQKNEQIDGLLKAFTDSPIRPQESASPPFQSS